MRQARSSYVESEEWGVCSNRRSSYYGKEKKYRDHCFRYERWVVLDR
jgi:hypothetical protein